MSTLLQEIRSQDEAFRSALHAVQQQENVLQSVLKNGTGRKVHLLGMGSSHLVGRIAAPLWTQLGWHAAALPAAEPLMHPNIYPFAPTDLALAISRSGTTPETLTVLKAAADQGIATICITVTPDTALGDAADIEIVIPEGHEANPAQTRSVTAHLAAAQAIALLAAERTNSIRQLVAAAPLLQPWIQQVDEPMKKLSTAFARAYFLGSADRWGLAMEGAIKLKECARCETEAFQSLDFRHGPLTMVDEQTLVIGLISASAADRELSVLREAAAAGATTLAIGEDLADVDEEFNAVSFHSGLPEPLQGVFYLPPLQLLAWHRAAAEGIDTGTIRNLSNLH